MADLQVIYDPDVELATIINLDTRKPLPIAAAGAQARMFMEGFINSTPWDISALTDQGIEDAWRAFLDYVGEPPTSTPAESDSPPMVEPDGPSVDDAIALAAREAMGATDVPAPAPADTDPPQDESTPTAVVRCWNCEGTGTIDNHDGTGVQRCGMCQGTGKVTMPVAT